MTITIAGNKKEYEEGVTVETLIEKENVENPLYVTVTINDDFVDREKFGETVLKDGDAAPAQSQVPPPALPAPVPECTSDVPSIKRFLKEILKQD